jgi:hypothetical protein
MTKFIKITVTEEGGILNVTLEKEGLTTFELIGLLTYYRDKIETDAMYPDKKDQEKGKP